LTLVASQLHEVGFRGMNVDNLKPKQAAMSRHC
jgi:hypothetical protein